MYRVHVDIDTPTLNTRFYLLDDSPRGRFALTFQGTVNEWVPVAEGTEAPITFQIPIGLAEAMFRAIGNTLHDPDEVLFIRKYAERMWQNHLEERMRVDKLLALVEKLTTPTELAVFERESSLGEFLDTGSNDE